MHSKSIKLSLVVRCSQGSGLDNFRYSWLNAGCNVLGLFAIEIINFNVNEECEECTSLMGHMHAHWRSKDFCNAVQASLNQASKFNKSSWSSAVARRGHVGLSVFYLSTVYLTTERRPFVNDIERVFADAEMRCL